MAFVGSFFCLGDLSSLAVPQDRSESGYLGSSQCRSCHERFYQLWGSSHHGLAMQPYTEAFAEKNLKPQLDEIIIGKARYRAVIDEGPGFVIESESQKQKKYPILHVLGGKNVFYFLTPLEKGHLQTLPVAYDVNKQQWFDTAASGIRHFPDRTDEAVHWTDREYTFNTACYACHVSQLVKNYDPKTDAYNTQWKEPGINCETCHGPADEHVRVCLEAGEGNVPKDLKLKTITQSRGFTGHQADSACSTCHAKGMPITNEFVPGDDFFQHSDLVTLEHPDFYSDGRDLGENYTFTTWRMSACAQSGKLDCVYCHTSSGRFRFKDTPDDACISCHSGKEKNFKAHTHHEKSDVHCIQCHMPMTDFARMNRSDHSMRPPMPSATIQFQSPNACNICHQDEDAKWADGHVRQWHKEDYQKPTLETAALIDQARKGNWKNLSRMLTYLQQKDKDEIFANSLIRLLQSNNDPRIAVVLTDLLKNDPSPLIRSSAANVLGYRLNEKTIPALAKATEDPYRLVRIRAVPSLPSVPDRMIPADLKDAIEKASQEYVASMASRPDDAMSHYNLGNFYMAGGKFKQAVDSYETAIKLQKNLILPYVNASLVYNHLGDNDTAAERLKQAIAIDPNSDAAHLNLALLYGEIDKRDKAVDEFRIAFKLNSRSASAAYNLCVLLAETDAPQAIAWAKKACQIQPNNAKYAYTLGFYLYQAKRISEVIATLEPFVGQKTTEVNIYLLLGDIYEQTGDITAAVRVYKTAAGNEQLSEPVRSGFRMHIQRLTSL
ncbi:MAG: tetratricopeptide repeat protein [Planctomycetes bacterium]|nr:tetratricopeptide repeat protein [Planctomycetota bacterium]